MITVVKAAAKLSPFHPEGASLGGPGAKARDNAAQTRLPITHLRPGIAVID